MSSDNQKTAVTSRLAFAILSGAIGSAFQHGYNIGVVNAPQILITNWLRNCNSSNQSHGEAPMDDCEMSLESGTMIWAWIASIFCIGGMIGGSTVGFLASYLGRKGGLLINNFTAIFAALLLFFSKSANSYELLIVGRLFIGINAGVNAGLCPLYLSEIAPVALRGAVGTVYQLMITISILLSQIFGMESFLGNDSGWPWLMGLTILPAFFQLLTLPFCPESPKYMLLEKGDEIKTTESLVWLRGKLDIHEEMDEMKAEMEASKRCSKVNLKEMLTQSSLRQPLIVAMMMMLAQQFTGITAAMFYSTTIFTSAGLSLNESQYATLAMGSMNVIMTVVSLFLIERAGRKSLMIAGLIIMTLSTTCLFLSLLGISTYSVLVYIAIFMVIGFVIGFATGPGSIPWFFVTELFTQSARPMATSIAVVTNWTANFMVGLIFAPIQLWIGPYVFIIFILAQIFFIFYVKLQVPETKNRTVEEITAIYQ